MIMAGKKRLYKGKFRDPEAAAREYDKVALLLHGRKVSCSQI